MSSIKIRSKRHEEQNYTEIRLLITHPMENGRNRDANDNFIPAHFIQELTVQRNGQLLNSAYLGGSMAQNPFLIFKAKGGQAGDKILVNWQDNLGNSDSEEHIVT